MGNNNCSNNNMEGGCSSLVVQLVNFGMVTRAQIVVVVLGLLLILQHVHHALLEDTAQVERTYAQAHALQEGMARVQLLIAQALALQEDTGPVQMINAQVFAVLVLIH